MLFKWLKKNQPRPINEALILRLPLEPTDEEILVSIRRWLEFMANGNYQSAVDAVSWRWNEEPEALREKIECFCGAEHRSQVSYPQPEVLKRTEIYRTGIPQDCKAAVGFFVALANGFGIWTTLIMRQHNDSCIFEFEIFHA